MKTNGFAGFLKAVFGKAFSRQKFFAVLLAAALFIAYNRPSHLLDVAFS
jgi:hypothetical protein